MSAPLSCRFSFSSSLTRASAFSHFCFVRSTLNSICFNFCMALLSSSCVTARVLCELYRFSMSRISCFVSSTFLLATSSRCSKTSFSLFRRVHCDSSSETYNQKSKVSELNRYFTRAIHVIPFGKIRGHAFKHCCTFVLFKKINVSFSCVCPVIDHEFRHNIVKVAVALTFSSFQIPRSRSLRQHRINYKFICQSENENKPMSAREFLQLLQKNNVGCVAELHLTPLWHSPNKQC